MSIEINELNIRYRDRIIKKRIGLKSFILISFFEKFMNMKHKPSKTVFINEKLEPMIIEIGKIENSIIGIIIFMFSIFFI
tara:strand:+ start:2418 stop:2657 length:240 start_codon:yes stop_codon:yes gene_type:complete